METSTKFVGFYEDAALPVKAGHKVTIRKGVVVRSTHPTKKAFTAGRSYSVKVDHILPGRSLCVGYYDNGEFHQMFASGNDHHTVRERFGTDDLTQLWALMRVDADKHVFLAIDEPSVRWPGTGGYWCEVSINDVVA